MSLLSSGFIPIQTPNSHPQHLMADTPLYGNPFDQPAPIVDHHPTSTATIPSHRPVQQTDIILVPEDNIEEILGQVEVVIPDIDLGDARTTIENMKPRPSTDEIVTYFLDNGYKKKVKNTFSNDPTRQTSLKRPISDTLDDIPKFLTSYADPNTFFFDTKRKQSESYINHARAFLLRAFPTTDKSILEQALQEENYHFLSTVRKLETRMGLRTNSFLQRSVIRRLLSSSGNLI
jgi:hypothetical protein